MALKSKKKAAPGNSKRKLVAKTDPQSPIAEQYRTIRTNILFSAVDQKIRSIMVTSSVPEEGKSTTAANLAIVFAQQDKKVLLVDADMRRPTMHYTFSTVNTVGLTNVLTKQADFQQAVNSTDVENLSLLSSGPIPPNPAELLGSKAMAEFLDRVYEEYEIVIFDTPPVLAVTDAQILANRCDGTVLVVSSGKTEVDNALKAKEMLTTAKSKIIGTVINNLKRKKTAYGNYYGN